MIRHIGIGSLTQEFSHAGRVASLGGLMQRRFAHRVTLHRRRFPLLSGGTRRHGGGRRNTVLKAFGQAGCAPPFSP